jgi:hypothetical protein
MNAALVKIDVIAADLGVGVRRIEAMVDGGDLVTQPLVWVFDFANDPGNGPRRELRFWRTEALALSENLGARNKLANCELVEVLEKILPRSRENFHAGEVDQLFQIRHNTRLDYADLGGSQFGGRNFYQRETLAAFLERRWLGAKTVAQR